MTSTKLNNMEYKGYFYKEIQVKDYKGNRATMYECSDKSLLKHTDTSSFSKFTEKRMKEAIDYYIGNVEYHKNLQKLTYNATKEFLKTK